MKISLFTDLKDIDIEESTWNELVSKNQTNTIFQTYEWFHCWWNACGPEYKLSLLIGEDKNKISLIAPLMISTEKNGKKILRFAGDINSDYCDFIINGDNQSILKETINWIFSSNIIFDAIILKNIPSESTTSQLINKICKDLKLSLINNVRSISPTLLINGNELYVSKIINKYSVKRHINKLQKNGEVTFKNITFSDEDALNKYLDIFFNQHISRFTEKNSQSLFTSEKYKYFYSNMINAMSEKNWIIFSVLEFNKQPIAFHLGFIYDNKFIWYKPSFDINYSRYSPGSVLLRFLIQYALENRFTEFDFTIGNEVYKNRFSNLVRSNENLFICKSRKDYYFQLFKKYLIVIQQNLIALINSNKK